MSGDAGGPAIEMLLYRPSSVPAFLQADSKVWTRWLERQQGYGGKLQLTNCPAELGCGAATFGGKNASSLVLELIYWHSRTEWKSVSSQELLQTGKQFNAAYASLTGSLASVNSTTPTALPLHANGEGFNVATCSGSWCAGAGPAAGAGGAHRFSTGDVVAAALGGLLAGMLLCACLARALRLDFRKGGGPGVSMRGSSSSLQMRGSSRSMSEDLAHSYELHVDGSNDSGKLSILSTCKS